MKLLECCVCREAVHVYVAVCCSELCAAVCCIALCQSRAVQMGGGCALVRCMGLKSHMHTQHRVFALRRSLLVGI